ncbi:MAG: hypothetical protein PWQ67_58 [Clostridia bacterium]|nr:hypothetical protein [Clostridia bacterium]MDN5321604.1 hypothetical protein [Clostridia bacterium]
MKQEQFWVVEKIIDGLVHFKNGSKSIVIPFGLIPGKVALGDIIRIDFDNEDNVVALKVVLKNTTER